MFGSYQFLYSGYDGFVKSHSGKVDASVDNSIISAVFLKDPILTSYLAVHILTF